MSLRITPQIYKWLQSMGLVKQGRRNNEFLQLPQDVSLKFYDGKHIGAILRNCYGEALDEETKKKLQTLKQNSNPAIRLYNWNILSEALKRMKLVIIQMGEKSKILNLQSQPVLKLLKTLYESRNKQQKEKQKKGLKVQISEMGKKGLLQSSNVMQFLIILLSKHFKLSPQHTVNLFLDNNKYLSHLLVKGVKNNYHPIYELINEIKQNIEFLVSHVFCIDEEENINFFFNAFKSCLISKDERTIQECLQLWMEIAIEYRVKGLDAVYLKGWIKNEGITTLFFTINKNPIYFQPIIQFLHQCLKQQLYQLFQSTTEKNLIWSNDKEKLSFLRKFLTLESKQIIENFFKAEPFIEDWMKYLSKISKRVKEIEQVYDTNIIFETLWIMMGERFQDQKLNMASVYLGFIRQSLGLKHFMNFFSILMSVFNLIKRLGTIKNSYAPQLFKLGIGVFSNMSSCSQEEKMTVMCEMMAQSLKEIKSLPGSGLVGGIIKHLQQTLQQQQQVNPAILQLARIILTEKRVSEQEAVELVQMLSKIIFQDVVYSGLAIDIVYSYIVGTSEQVGDQYLLSASKISLANVVSVSKSITKSIQQLRTHLQSLQQNQTSKHNKQSLLPHIKKLLLINCSIQFLMKYLQLNDINLKNALEMILFHTYVKIKLEMKKKHVADYLLPVMKVYYQNKDELEEMISQFEKEHYPSTDDLSKHSLIIPLKSLNHRNSYTLSTEQPSLEMKTIDPSILKPSQFAIKDLQTLKLKKEQLKTIEIQREKLNLDSETKLKQAKSYMNEKRLIQYGSKEKIDFQYKNLYDFDTVKQEEFVSGVPIIKLVDFDKEQESTYEDDLKSVMKKYRKVWRFLFFKYSTFGAKKQEFKTEQKISTAEIWKMLKEYELFPLLKKEESQMIMKLINDKMRRKGDPQTVTYGGFEEYIMQLCAYGYDKFKYSHIPAGRQVTMFIQQLKRVTKQKGGSIQLFQNPEDIYFQQTDVVRQYNRRLKQNPDYILPEGYKKYKLQVINYQYSLHPALLNNNINQSYADVYEVLHAILLERLSISLIEPLSTKSQTTLTKPVLFQNITEKMKQYKRGYLQPKMTIQIPVQKSKSLRRSIVLKKQFKPHINFSLGIKLGLSSVSVKNKSIAEEVAYWMHDMLAAIENESLKVQKGKRKVQNVVIRRRRVESLQKLRRQKSQKKQWRKRAQSVKLRLQVERKLKKEQQIKKKEKQLQEKRRRRAKQQSELKGKLMRFEEMRRVISQKQQTKKYQQQEQKDKRKQRMQQYRQRVGQYFEKKRQEILQKQQELRRKKQQQQRLEQQQKQKKENFAKQLYLNNLKKQQSLLQQADEVKEQYYELYNSQEIANQFNNFSIELSYLFNLLLKHEKSRISSTRYNEISFNTLNFWCLKFMIVPFMVQKQQLNQIFKFIVRERGKRDAEAQEKETSREQINTQGLGRSLSSYRSNNYMGSINNSNDFNNIRRQDTSRNSYSIGLDFNGFKQALFLFSVKAKKLLNNIITKRKKNRANKNRDQQEGKGQQSEERQQSESQQEQQDKQIDELKSVGLINQYLFRVDGVRGQTLREVLKFLKLPKDKLGVDERYRKAIQSKNITKPRNILIEQLKREMLNEESITQQQQEEQSQNRQQQQEQQQKPSPKR